MTGHPLPLLPVGVVCDKCNNGVLSTLDQVLMNFDPIAMVRVHYAIPTKAGKWPIARFGDAKMQRMSEGHVYTKADRPGSVWETPVGFSYKFRGRRSLNARHTRELTRALFKIALGMIYLEDGEPSAFLERFDGVREMIRGVRPFHGYLLAGMEEGSSPQKEFQCIVRYFPIQDGEKRTILVYLNYGSVVLGTDLETRDASLFTKWPKDAPIVSF